MTLQSPLRPLSPVSTTHCTGAENGSTDVEGRERLFVCTKCRCESDKSLHRLLSEALLWRKEKERLKELLRTTTNALEDKAFALTSYQTSMADLLIAQTEEDGPELPQPFHTLALDLKERLSFSEMQMEILREERDRSVLSLSKLERKVATCTSLAEEQSEFIRCQLTTIHKLEERAAHLQSMLHQAEKDKIKNQKQHEEQLLLHQQHAALQEERLKQRLQEQEATQALCRKVEKKVAALEDEIQDQIEMYHETSKALDAAREELAQKEDKSKELYEAKEQMDQTRTDNARLVQLLASTGLFGDLFEEMEDSNGSVYIPLTAKASKFQSLVKRYYSSNGRAVNPKLEADHWIPVEAFDIALDFRRQYCPSLPITAVNDLMAQLSYFWRELEKRKMAQIRARSEKALVDLKRKHSMSRQYEEVVGPSFVKPVRLRRAQRKVLESSITNPQQRYSKVQSQSQSLELEAESTPKEEQSESPNEDHQDEDPVC